MRKALYLHFAAALLVCSAMVLAQESGSTSSPSQSGAQATSQSGTSGASAQTGTSADQSSTSGQAFQGCLMGSSGNYTLTDATGASYQLQGDDSLLSSNVNKQVEVMGTPSASASASASGPGSSSDNASAGSEAGSASSQGGSTAQASASKTLNVTSVHKIADSCGGGSQSPQ